MTYFVSGTRCRPFQEIDHVGGRALVGMSHLHQPLPVCHQARGHCHLSRQVDSRRRAMLETLAYTIGRMAACVSSLVF